MNVIDRLFIESIAFISIVGFILWYFLKKLKYYRKFNINDFSLSLEDLEKHAKKTALEHIYSNNKKTTNWPIPRMNDNYEFIFSVYKELNEDIHQKKIVPSAAEWLLDNFYIVEEQTKLLRRDINKKSFSRLPVLKSGYLQGNSRIFVIALELVSHTNGQINEEVLSDYLKAYQTQSVLFEREIWAIPIVIRLALLENIRYLSEKIKNTQIQWRKADDLFEDWLTYKGTEEKKFLKTLKNILKSWDGQNLSFIEHFLFRLRRSGLSYNDILHVIDENLTKQGKTSDDIAQEEHDAQSINTISFGNCITSLRYFSTMDWGDLFESASFVDQILKLDPDGTYSKMDLSTRNYYRGRVEELSAIFGVSQLHIAREVVELSKQAYLRSDPESAKNSENSRLWHVGYYLIGKGVQDLKCKLGKSNQHFLKVTSENQKISGILYLGSIALLTLIIVAMALQYAILTSKNQLFLFSLLACIAVLIPASEIAVLLVNFIVCKTVQPAVFPKLELKEGIPEDLSTIIVIPTLLPDENRVKEILENLESHYLSNRENNLYFALIGAFRDSDQETIKNKDKIIDAALSGIQMLNKKYSLVGKDIFFFFHRKSQFNEKNNNWFGWERKRGALMEFNDLVLGENNTSFTYCSCDNLPFSSVKYIITLDSDTILPIGMAKKMIGAMAHPLNTPVIDEKRGIVVQGYGIMQPRVEVDLESSNKSLFSLIFTGQEGIDPYANAISDVYQDLFDEGIFTGKGIYDLRVFQKILKDAIPENAILSHDLLEGSYVRTGLVTDLELVDSYPTKYNAYSSRIYRWARGDWQLFPFLFRKIFNHKQKKIFNPLSLLSRWKMLDNLRRSLVSPSLILLLALLLSVLPGNIYIWFGFFVLTITLPFLMSFVEYIFTKRFGFSRSKRHMPVMVGLKASFLQLILTLLFLPYQALLMLNAIFITLGRLFITKKNLLEWITSADLEKSQKNTLKNYVKKMMLSLSIPLVFLLLAITNRPSGTILSVFLLVFWSMSPLVAYLVSRDKKENIYKVTMDDNLMLHRITRKTWRYFEEFSDSKNHFLAPDNYQVDPLKGVTYRTSPTNIGLGLLATLTARDFGYITTSEMVDLTQKTVSTILSLEKWNGHLYNWYDTRTLKPLRPGYISTVDSGNLLCYLITLEQGLIDYLHSPLITSLFIQGIKDTLLCGGKESLSVYQKIESSLLKDNGEYFDLVWGSSFLNDLLTNTEHDFIKEPIWKMKYVHLITMYQKEITTFFPWVALLKRIPEDFKNLNLTTELAEMTKKLLDIQTKTFILADLPTLYKESNQIVEKLVNYLLNEKTENYQNGLAWLQEWTEALLSASQSAELLIESFILLKDQITLLTKTMTFLPLYVKKKQLFSIGYNMEDNKLTNSYYDLFASEARQTSYMAIARGDVPPSHWFKLGRSLTTVDGYKGLVSWTGSMFEYLMPVLLFKSYKNTLLEETYSFVIKSQKKYGKQMKMPWGVSESGFNMLDQNLEYQYKAIGVPWLGLKRGLVEDAVCTPYATFLALQVDPGGAIQNIKYLITEGLEGMFGFYEASDYTKERLCFESKRVIVKSFMAHHQGMTLLALNNFLHDEILQKRFHSDPTVNSARLLLQEKIPTNIVFTKESKEKVISYKEVVSKEKYLVRKFTQPDPVLPKVHILTNGSYSVMLTDKGGGYSKNKLVSITRWREDSSLDQYGMFFYLRQIESNHIWSATYSPLNKMPEKYEVMFSSDKATFKRVDQQIETTTEVVVAPGDNVEIRRITLKNLSEKPCMIEITSYFDVVLSPQNADIAHPAFQNLFVETQIHSEKNCIIAKRRPRGETDKSMWIGNAVLLECNTIGDIQFETDRMAVIGRGHSVKDPDAIMKGKPLSNTSGSVLDPVMSIRVLVKIEGHKTASVSFITAVSDWEESLFSLLDKYSTSYGVGGAFRLALARSQLENKYLNLAATEMEIYLNMLSHVLFISPTKRQFEELILKNRRGQSFLWGYGISGDNPIILVNLKKTDHMEILYEILKAHEYWLLLDLKIDLVILSEEEFSYNLTLHGLIVDIVMSKQTKNTLKKPGEIFILDKNKVSEEDLSLLHSVARIIFTCDNRTIHQQMMYLIQQEYPPSITRSNQPIEEVHALTFPKKPELQFFNGLGGFSLSDREYVIQLEKGQHTPAPWVNVIANPSFGFISSEAGSSFTWFSNSHEYKLTPWSNDAVVDPSGEIIYISEPESGKVWTVTSLPIREEENYTVRHGFGYSTFEHNSHGIEQKLVQFVPENEAIKVSILSLKNSTNHERHLTLTYYLRPILGINDQETARFIQTSLGDSDVLMVKNPYNSLYPDRITFLDTSIRERTVSGDRKEFFGSGDYQSPQCLSRTELSGLVGTAFDPCSVVQVKLTLMPFECKDVVFLLGTAPKEQQVSEITSQYKNVEKAKIALDEVQRSWKNRINILQVNTPADTMNIMLNGWLPYQVISCRLWARSGFYQTSGAFGFRDQLQDSLSVAHISPEITRSQILHHAQHQFQEGDVEHWWHEPQGLGIRTRCSDDLLWLPYVVAEYIRITGDSQILEEKLSFLEEPPLNEFENERIVNPKSSELTYSLYDHCKRAIDLSLKWGTHGLPLMGSGDWNDGMNTVGNKGLGESVWLGWFLITTLKIFAPICNKMNDEMSAINYSKAQQSILTAIEKNAWDGMWYLRAFFDNGQPLGSTNNKECKIDSIAQTWAVISGEGNKQRALIAMKSLEDFLIRREEGLIKLITPPFNDCEMEPGYIKGYLPGVRENGGQYTHAAVWVIIAFVKLGDGDKAWELFELINPINHTENLRECTHYKVEPYVFAADVYSEYPNQGRGGWTWYTGSAGWVYRAGFEYILGFQKNGDTIIMDPCIPKKWKEYSITYQHLSATYHITVKNPSGVCQGVLSVEVDGETKAENRIPLIDDGITHQVVVIMGSPAK